MMHEDRQIRREVQQIVGPGGLPMAVDVVAYGWGGETRPGLLYRADKALHFHQREWNRANGDRYRLRVTPCYDDEAREDVLVTWDKVGRWH
jgi:hypothetical protein